MGLIKRIIKLLVLPLIVAVTLIQWVGIFFTQFSTVIFNLLAGLMFLITIAGWMFGISAGAETLRLLAVAFVVFIIPHIAEWLITVIRAIYDAVEQMGFRTGNILEPSCGVGNFFGMLPESMAGSRLYGVELDSISGRIARQLYPKADITVAGFETTDRRDFYDLAIGNVPFGQYAEIKKDLLRRV